MTRAQDLLTAYSQLDWEIYVTLADDLCRVTEDIHTELTNHARLYSYYSGLYEVGKRDVERIESDLEKTRAAASIKVQEDLKSGGTRATVATIEAHVCRNGDVVELEGILRDERLKLGLLKSLITALSQKKDMLVQLSSNDRAEKKLYS